MTRYFNILPLALTALTVSLTAQAQETAAATTTTGAVRAIPVSDQMFRKTIWRAIDLREKQNRPMFSDNKEISKVIIEAVKRGELTAYKNDSVTSTLNAKEMSANMSFPLEAPIAADGDDWGGTAVPSSKPAKAKPADDGWGAPATAPKKPATTKRVPVLDSKGKQVRRNGKLVFKTVPITSVAATPPPAPATSAEYRYKDIYQMELSEEMIFDKKRSRMYHQIKTISLKLPSTLKDNVSGLEKNIASFKYSDLVKVFRNNPQTAIWFNEQNDAQHKNLADAFELWLFNSYITKVSNAKGDDLASQYGGEYQGLLASQEIASSLVEYEYNLWSF